MKGMPAESNLQPKPVLSQFKPGNPNLHVLGPPWGISKQSPDVQNATLAIRKNNLGSTSQHQHLESQLLAGHQLGIDLRSVRQIDFHFDLPVRRTVRGGP